MPEQQAGHADLLISGAAELLTCARDAPDLIGHILGGGVAVKDGQVLAVGDVSAYTADRYVDAAGGVLMPGFIDAHTHVVFGGTRLAEYSARVAGVLPPPGASLGIGGTMSDTRATSHERLVGQSAARVAEMLAHGTTTLESKSGYGLQASAELRLLQANAELGQQLPVEVASTYLGAHAFPVGTDPARYVDQVIDLIPQIAERRLAEFCDVYCDSGYFELAQARRILQAGLEHGLVPKMHLDAYSHTGAAALAAELGAASVDHLNYTSASELTALAAAGVVGVYLPCLEYAAAHPNPLNPRAALDAGIELALATDLCPGCWITSMQLAVAMACRAGGLSVAQALRAATYGAARSLGREDRVGSLVVGMQADLIVLDVPSHEDIAYRIGRNSVTTVIKAGRVIKEVPR